MLYSILKDNIKKILIEESIKDDADVSLLKKELSCENKDIKYEIIFVGIESVPKTIVELLSIIKKQATIITTSKTLWAYLSKLGIKNNLKNEYEFKTSLKKQPLKAIAIGGSAGSIEKTMELIEYIPFSDISVFIVIHILPDKKSHLSSIIKNKTGYKVLEASHNTEVEKNCIYIAPPDYHLTVIDNYIYLDKSDLVNFSRPSIDITFKSLAYEYQNTLLAILLCGYGNDGAKSLEDLKQNNSEILVEDPKDCEAKDILINSIATNNYTKVLPIEQIKKYVKSILSVEVDIEDEIERFLDNIKLVYGYDFKNYDRNSLSRRIELVMQQSMIKTFHEFEQIIFKDELLFAKLLSAFSINVTTFFRNPDIFQTIREDVVSYIESYPSIRVWCAGCSRGDEPYSVAIMLDEMGLLNKSMIYATDFNLRIINEAKNGLFPTGDFKEFESNYLKSGGKKNLQDWFDVEDNFVQVKDHIKKKVLFFQHNLVSDGSINEFHLIFCRNVLIYFDKILQKKVFENIDNSLYKGGFLVLGESEMLPKKYTYKTIGKISKKIYQRELV